MNKAFMKEPESDHGHCPRCDQPGAPVRQETLQAHLTPDALRNLTDSAFFCPYANCPVVYFDMFDRTVTQDELRTPVYPKSPDAPICACFGLTREGIEQDIREGVVTRTRALLDRAKTADANCALKAFSGQCCVPEVQRYYMRLRSGAGG